jgi:tetratricopeptide (TPR) repeat protein
VRVNEILEKGLKLVKNGRIDEAINLYENFLREKEVPEILNNLGNLYRMKGMVSRAIELYERALKMDPSFNEVKINLAASFLEIGRYGEAMIILESLKSNGVESDELYLALAVAYEKSKRYAEFIEMYRKVKRKDKDEILRSYGVNPPDG